MKLLIKKLIQHLPVNIRKSMFLYLKNTLSHTEKQMLGHNDIFSGLERIKSYNYYPSLILDIGAHEGLWSKKIIPVFPDAEYILAEPLPDKLPVINQNLNGNKIIVYNNLIGNENKKHIPFFSMETGSSVLEEQTNYPRSILYADMITIDSITANKIKKDNILIKLDVQGFELEVLKGATETLKQTDVICIEIALLDFNANAPLIDEVISVLKIYDFVCFDITGFFRKSNDGALSHADFIFVRTNGCIRKKVNGFKEDFKIVEL